ncbi:MAG: DUF2142 domain-containing protein, partial [Eubacteriales bacterium]|nr:DUF2142 domain-containing protein [Eubacteriales bacterium]
DLMRHVVREISVHPFVSGSVKETIRPGDTLEQIFTADRGDFHTLELSISSGQGRSDSVHVRITGGQSGEKEYYDRDLTGSSILAGGPAGKIIRIDAEDSLTGEAFPPGVYHIFVTNLDKEKSIKLSVLEEKTASGSDQGSISENGLEDSRGENTEDASDQEDTDLDDVSDETAVTGDSRLVTRTLNFALLRRSGLGYGIACLVFLILGIYMILTGSLLIGNAALPGRFFVVSVIPLGLIYMILVPSWRSPDARSHILAVYRLSNMVLGGDESQEWTMRARDAAYLPASWTTEKAEPYYTPKMQDYAYAYQYDVKAVPYRLLSIEGRDPALAAASSTEEGKAPEYAAKELNRLVKVYQDEKMTFYSAVNYLPQTLGLTLARILGMGAPQAMAMARLLTLAAYIAALLHTIRITPAGKAAFAAIGLLPAPLILAGSFSYDAMLLIAAFGFLGALLRLCEEREGKAAFIECVLWTVLLGAVKGGGHLILLPLSAIPVFHAAREGREAAEKTIRRTLTIIAAGGGSALVFDVILPSGALFQFGTKGSGNLTFSYALAHPVRYLNMMAGAYLNEMDIMISRMSGMMLIDEKGNDLPFFIGFGLMSIAVVFLLFEKDSFEFTERDRKVMKAVVFLEIITTPMMLLSWNKIGARTITGLHGRYYLPVLPLIFLLFTKFKLHDGSRPESEVKAIGKSCMCWFCFLSCLGVYYLLRACLTR